MNIEEMRTRLEDAEDVKRLLELEERSDGRFRYLIETPYEFPAFVVGHVSADYTDVVHELKCGAEWSARAQWEKSNTPS